MEVSPISTLIFKSTWYQTHFTLPHEKVKIIRVFCQDEWKGKRLKKNFKFTQVSSNSFTIPNKTALNPNTLLHVRYKQIMLEVSHTTIKEGKILREVFLR